MAGCKEYCRREYVNPGCIVDKQFSASQNLVDIILLADKTILIR